MNTLRERDIIPAVHSYEEEYINSFAQRMVARYKEDQSLPYLEAEQSVATLEPEQQTPEVGRFDEDTNVNQFAQRMVAEYKANQSVKAAPQEEDAQAHERSAGTLVNSPRISKLPNEAATQSIATRERLPKTPESAERRPMRNFLKALGGLAIGFVGVGLAMNLYQEKSGAIEAPATTEQSAPATATTTTLAPETTTTQPEAPFSVEPGQIIANINLPSIEEEVTIYELSREDALTATHNPTMKQLSPIDFLIPDETPNIDNEQVQQWAAETGAVSRGQRVRNSARGNVNQWRSIAGHVEGDTILPDSEHAGNSVFFGHGSTFNAAFANLGALHEKDPLIMLRADGKILNYTFIEKEIIDTPNLNDPADVERALRRMNEYRKGDGKKYVTLYHCGDRNGLPGDQTTRVMYRFILDE